MKSLTKKVLSLILLFAVFGFSHTLIAQTTLTAEQVAQKTASVISNAKGLTASFSIQGNGNSGAGTIKSSGNKFQVILPGVGIWYNGKNLYTYSGRSNETTLVSPTAAELLESNPLLYLKSGGGGYKYSFSSVKRNGKYVVEAAPKNGKGDIKKMTFTVNSSSFKPERIVVTTRQGTITIEIKDLKTNVAINANEFEYPKSKYPKAEIVDLR